MNDKDALEGWIPLSGWLRSFEPRPSQEEIDSADMLFGFHEDERVKLQRDFIAMLARTPRPWWYVR